MNRIFERIFNCLGHILGILIVFGMCTTAIGQSIGTINNPQAVRRLQLSRQNLVQTQNDLMIPFNVPKDSLYKYELLEYGSSGWSVAAGRIGTLGSGLQVRITAGKQFVLRDTTTTSIELSREKTYIPGSVIFYPSPPPPGTLQQPRYFEMPLFIMIRDNPLTWDVQKSAYSTKLIVGIENPTTGGLPIQLPYPVNFQVLMMGAGVSVTPSSLTVITSGIGGVAEADLDCTTLGDSLAVKVVTDVGTNVCHFNIQPQVASLLLESGKSIILGLGLESIDLSISRLAENKQAYPAHSPLSVQLTSTSGVFKSTLAIPANSMSVGTKLRSQGWGSATIQASAGVIHSDSINIRFRFPWAVLILNVIFACGFSWGRHKDKTGKALRIEIGIGALAGLFLLACIVLGLVVLAGLPPGSGTTEVGSIVIGGIGGYLGREVINLIPGINWPGGTSGQPNG